MLPEFRVVGGIARRCQGSSSGGALPWGVGNDFERQRLWRRWPDGRKRRWMGEERPPMAVAVDGIDRLLGWPGSTLAEALMASYGLKVSRWTVSRWRADRRAPSEAAFDALEELASILVNLDGGAILSAVRHARATCCHPGCRVQRHADSRLCEQHASDPGHRRGRPPKIASMVQRGLD